MNFLDDVNPMQVKLKVMVTVNAISEKELLVLPGCNKLSTHITFVQEC